MGTSIWGEVQPVYAMCHAWPHGLSSLTFMPCICMLQKIAAEVDPDGRGLLDFQEVRWPIPSLLLPSVGLRLPIILCPCSAPDCDLPRSGWVISNCFFPSVQFLTVVSRDLKNYDNESDLKGAWKVFDREGKGFISTAELKHVLGNIGEALSPTELDDLCKEADPNTTGKVMFEEVRGKVMFEEVRGNTWECDSHRTPPV